VTGMTNFRVLVNAGVNFTGKTVYLTANIPALAGWTGIGTSTNTFRGTFDGQYCTINGLIGSQGLFAYTGAATILNLRITGVSITAATTGNYGCLVGYSGGTLTITNVQIAGNITVNYTNLAHNYVGGFVGNPTAAAYMSRCAFEGNVTSTHSGGGGANVTNNVGGLASSLPNGSSVQNCFVSGMVAATISYVGDQADYWVGGIAGWSDWATIRNCVIYAGVRGRCANSGGEDTAAGGVVAQLPNTTVRDTVGLCSEITHNSTSMSASAMYAAALIGSANGAAATVSNIQSVSDLITGGVRRTTTTRNWSAVYNTATARADDWFNTQSNYTNAANWNGGALNFDTLWEMTANGPRLRFPQRIAFDLNGADGGA